VLFSYQRELRTLLSNHASTCLGICANELNCDVNELHNKLPVTSKSDVQKRMIKLVGDLTSIAPTLADIFWNIKCKKKSDSNISNSAAEANSHNGFNEIICQMKKWKQSDDFQKLIENIVLGKPLNQKIAYPHLIPVAVSQQLRSAKLLENQTAAAKAMLVSLWNAKNIEKYGEVRLGNG